MTADAIGELVPVAQANGVRLGLEALHPVFAADRCVITRLGEALDLALAFPADAVGVVVDTYHVWWDASLLHDIARAGERIVSYQVCDWILPLPANTLLGAAATSATGTSNFPPITAAVRPPATPGTSRWKSSTKPSGTLRPTKQPPRSAKGSRWRSEHPGSAAQPWVPVSRNASLAPLITLFLRLYACFRWFQPFFEQLRTIAALLAARCRAGRCHQSGREAA